MILLDFKKYVIKYCRIKFHSLFVSVPVQGPIRMTFVGQWQKSVPALPKRDRRPKQAARAEPSNVHQRKSDLLQHDRQLKS